MENSILNDGTKIQRAYKDVSLEQKRVEAINKMGTHWIMHPKNFVQREVLK